MAARTVESFFAAYNEMETDCSETSDDFQVTSIASDYLTLTIPCLF